jgi:hypothetical protein
MNSLRGGDRLSMSRNSKIAIAADQFLGLDERPIDHAELAFVILTWHRHANGNSHPCRACGRP